MALSVSPATLPIAPLARLSLIAGGVSALLLIGALGFQYIGGLRPCDICYWQRYVHVAVVVLAVAALVARGSLRTALFGLAVAALAMSAGVALYHMGIEWKWWPGPQTCSGAIPRGLSPEELRRRIMETPPVRCDEIAWSLFGLSMAGWNFVISTALAAGLAITALRHRLSS